MITSIELQIISRLLTTESEDEKILLCSYDESYYSVFKEHIRFIFDHRNKYGSIPDVFTFQSEFPDINLVRVSEPVEYLINQLKKNKQHIIFLETFNKIKDLGSGDITEAWQYIGSQYDKVLNLESTKPLDLIHDANKRSEQIVEFSKQTRIPTGFPEIDKLMYGGLSTVEELVLVFARTNSGKSWLCVKMMESAQKNGFPVLYYSPEMQASFLGTRFDTWRGHFQNNLIFQGKYSDEYKEYLKKLPSETSSAFVIEDKDIPGGSISVSSLESIVNREHIKLLIIDGLSYMSDDRRSVTDYDKYKNICLDLFKLSKKYGCAVVVAMQANRESREAKDDKGEPFPTLYNVEGSDHPARICTQAFAVRQIFDKHVLDIRLEKARMANNQKPVFSYSWDVNTGNMRYLPGGDDEDPTASFSPVAVSDIVHHVVSADTELDDSDFDDDIEF